MASEYYKQALMYLEMESRRNSDASDDDVKCVNCESQPDLFYSFNRRGSVTKKDYDADECPVCGGKLVCREDGKRRDSESRLRRKKGQTSHIRWADECKKELVREHPRKTYRRNPSVKPQPIKPILKHSLTLESS